MIRNDFLTPLENHHPASQDYLSFWRQEKRRCIEGFWAGGYYMPPALYFYVNYATIRLNKGLSDVKSFDRPMLRDVEWEFFQAMAIARGFSGFEDDPEYTCLKKVTEDYPLDYFRKRYPEVINSSGYLKKYEDPLTYIKRKHDYQFSKPLYHNQKKNFLYLGSRGGELLPR